MPSLWLYLRSLHAEEGFYAWVVAVYSVGEAVGSVAIGSFSNRIGAKVSLLLTAAISLVGASAYALAGPLYAASRGGVEPSSGVDPHGFNPAPWTVLFGRLLQGIGSGGQQAVEQAYLAVAAPPEQRTELTGHLSTCACLGFICGPAVGALYRPATGSPPARLSRPKSVRVPCKIGATRESS